MGTDRVALVVVALLAACGDDSPSAGVDAGIDSGTDGGTIDNIPCDYTESQDLTNSTVPNAEPSNLTLGASRIVICGKMDTGHYDATQQLVDADGIEFSVAAETDVIVHLVGNGVAMPDRMIVQIIHADNRLYGFGVVEGDHASFIFRIPADEYVLAVYALNGAALSSAIDYKVLIDIDTPRCAAKSVADHNEGTDGGANDVIDFTFNSNNQSSLSASTTDAPEVTNFTIASGSSYAIAGTMADVDPPDDYMDRDTFAFTTGPTTTQMTVRLNWPTVGADLDFRLYPAGIPQSFAAGIDTANTEFELETFAVKPNTMYWLWIAQEDGTTAPATYSATLCGETFTP